MAATERVTRARPREMVAVSPTSFVGGAESALLTLLVAARADGWRATVVTPAGEFADRLRDEGFAVVPLPDLKLPAGPRVTGAVVALGRSVQAGLVVRRAAAGADLVLANGTRVLPAVALARVPCPTIHLVRDVIVRRSWRALLRVFGRSATLAVAASDAGARPLRDLGLAVRVVHHGVRWPVPPAPTDRDGAPVMGLAAGLTPLKGQHVAIDALARLARDDVVLELAGAAFSKDREYEAALRSRAARPDVAGRVRFLGHEPDVLAVMRRWSVALVPSTRPDLVPLSMLEAMSVGVPVVAADHGGPSELLGAAGLLVAPDDPEAVAVAVDRLLADDRLARQCGQAGMDAVEHHFNTAREQRELVATLDEVATGAGR